MDVCTLPDFQWIGDKDLPFSTGNSAQRQAAAWMGGELGGEWVHACLRLRPFTVHLKLSQRSQSARP